MEIESYVFSGARFAKECIIRVIPAANSFVCEHVILILMFHSSPG